LIRPGTDRERIAGSKKCLGEGAALAGEPGNSGGNRNVILSEGFTFRNFLVDVFAIFMFVLWFWVLIGIISDLFRRHDISGWGKAIWKGVIVLVSAYHSRRSHQMTIGSTIQNSPVSVLYGLMIVSLIALLPFPPLLQNQSYHEFADQRELFGIPNFWKRGLKSAIYRSGGRRVASSSARFNDCSALFGNISDRLRLILLSSESER